MRLAGLYAITDSGLLPDARLAPAVAEAVAGGARWVQYRDKRPGADREALARRLRDVCRAGGAGLVVNDDVELAAAVGADGVHLGRDDGAIDAARRRLGPTAVIGASCYDSPERARAAVAAGADYVAFGRFFPSATKPGAPPARLETLAWAAAELPVPVCAIGGIHAGNAGRLIDAGAHLVAVVGGVFASDDPRRAAAAIAGQWPRD